jgi:hypothetical protein
VACSEFGFESHHIFSVPIFAGELNGIHEVVYFLIVQKLLVNLWSLLQSYRCPEQIPVVLICLLKILGLQNLPQDLGLRVYQLEEGRVGVGESGNVEQAGVRGALNEMQRVDLVIDRD